MPRVYSRGTRNIAWLIVVLFVLAGAYFAWTHRFEQWAGRALERAAPAARHVIPKPAKEALREVRKHLPVYGQSSTWIARKSASIIYFGIVSAFVIGLRRRRPASLRETLLVTVVAGVAMSATVELLEWPEDTGDQIFDLGCGAVGGLIAGMLAWIRLRPRPI